MLRMRARSRRSGRCSTCKRRKVKCDEAIPECSLCSRLGVACNYPDQLDIDFRDESRKASKRADGLWRQRAAPTEPKTRDRGRRVITSASSTHTTHSRDRTTQLITNPGGQGAIYSRAINLFFRDFSHSGVAPGAWLGFFQSLPELYGQSSADSCVSHAISAVSLAYMAHRQRIPQSEWLGRLEYTKAIRLVKSQLEVQLDQDWDQTLAAICLMGLFETFSQGIFEDDHSWIKHLDGAVSIVLLRGSQLSRCKTSLDLSRVVFFQMLVRCLQKKTRPPLSLSLFTRNLHAPPIGLRLVEFMHCAAELCAVIDRQTQGSPSQDVAAQRKITQLIAVAGALDEQMSRWESLLPSPYQYSVTDQHPWLLTRYPSLSWPGAPRVIYTYPLVPAALARVLYFATRLILNQSLARCMRASASHDAPLDQGSPHGCPETPSPQDTVAAMAGGICRSALSALEIENQGTGEHQEAEPATYSAVRGLAVMWPLRVAAGALADGSAKQPVQEQTDGATFLWLERLKEFTLKLVGVGDVGDMPNTS